MSQIRVLVVDDDPWILRMVSSSLEKRGTYSVETARDGQQALHKAQASRPDIVISDVMMPVMDGWALVQSLRADPGLADVPVLFLTALGKDEDRLRALGLKPDDYVSKPFRFDDLERRVLKALAKRGKVEDPSGFTPGSFGGPGGGRTGPGRPPPQGGGFGHPGNFGPGGGGRGPGPSPSPSPAPGGYPQQGGGGFGHPGNFGPSTPQQGGGYPQQGGGFPQQGGGYPQQGYPQQGYPQQGGGYPQQQQGGGYPQQQQGGGYPQQQQGGGYPQQGGFPQQGYGPPGFDGNPPAPGGPQQGYGPGGPQQPPPAPAPEAPEPADPSPSASGSFSGTMTRTGLSGRLEQLGLSSLLVMMEMERKDGVLQLQNSESKKVGRIFIRKGQVIQARLDKDDADRTGPESVYYMLTWAKGRFHFTAMDIDMDDEIKSSTTSLLMEGARLIDEANR